MDKCDDEMMHKPNVDMEEQLQEGNAQLVFLTMEKNSHQVVDIDDEESDEDIVELDDVAIDSLVQNVDIQPAHMNKRDPHLTKSLPRNSVKLMANKKSSFVKLTSIDEQTTYIGDVEVVVDRIVEVDDRVKSSESMDSIVSVPISHASSNCSSLSSSSEGSLPTSRKKSQKNKGIKRFSTLAKNRAYSVTQKLLSARTFRNYKTAELKIDTFRAFDIGQLFLLFYISIITAACFSIVIVIHLKLTYDSGSVKTPYSIQMTEFCLQYILRAFIAILAPIYVYRISQLKKQQPIQIIIAVISTFFAIIYFVQNVSATFMIKKMNLGEYQYCRYSNVDSILNAFLSGLIFSVLTQVSRCYNVKHSDTTFFSRNYTTCSIVVISSYVVLRVILSYYSSLVIDYLPLINLTTIARFYFKKDYFSMPQMVTCLSITICDVLLSLWSCYEIRQAKISFRTSFVGDVQNLFLGFNFFMFQNAQMVFSLVICGQIVSFVLPLDLYYDSQNHGITLPCTGTILVSTGFLVSIVFWLYIAMYGSLPAGAKGLRGWFPSRLDEEVDIHTNATQVQYFFRESDVFLRANFGLNWASSIDIVNPKHFILETQIEMFNFAYLAYACGNKSYNQDFVDLQNMIGNTEYSLVDHIYEPTTDTHCLICQSKSRIVVSFKGTTSWENAKTDMKATHIVNPTALDYILPDTTPDFVPRNISRPNLCKSSSPWVHGGFWNAYASVSNRVLDLVKDLLSENSRRIAVTGHSLGGSLAMLCSFDIAVKINTSNIFCTTFGSPRIAGNAFKKKYNMAVPATFRFVNSADVVTDYPPRTIYDSFTELGTTVLMDRLGNLIVDPNLLEYELFNMGVSTEAHSLSSYQFSLLMWSIRAHGSKFKPQFWSHSLQQLRSKYGNITEVVDYLRTTTLKSPASGLGGNVNKFKNEKKIINSLKKKIMANNCSMKVYKQRLRWYHTKDTVCYAAQDLICYLIDERFVTNEAAALETGRVLLAKGYIELVGASYVFGKNSFFYFPLKKKQSKAHLNLE